MTDEEDNWILRARDQMSALTSETLYTVVGVDDFAFAGDDDCLYLVSQRDDAGVAAQDAREHTERTGDQAYVYPPRRPTVRVVARLADGTVRELEPMTYAEYRAAAAVSPGGALRVIFDQGATAEHIAAVLNAVQRG